jgi:hypothetical protein
MPGMEDNLERMRQLGYLQGPAGLIEPDRMLIGARNRRSAP